MADFIRPTLEQALEIAPLLRPDDVAELTKSGDTPEGAIIRSFNMSDHVWLARLNDEPAALIGIGRTSILGNIGSPWFLTTPVMDTWEAKRELLRLSPTFVSDFMGEYDMLSNYVDAQYVRALRWLEWLGFTIGEPIQSPITGAVFHEIKMERGEQWVN